MEKLKIENLPEEAVGTHTVDKVQILKTAIRPNGKEKTVEIDYALVLLENDVIIELIPKARPVEGQGIYKPIAYLFNHNEKILLMSEGKTFRFEKQLKANIKRKNVL